MKQKCGKYQALFTFSSDIELEEHIKNCPECKCEQETMDKVSALICEVRPVILKKREQSRTRYKIACCILALVIGSSGFMFTYTGNTPDTLTYGQILSAGDYGFPVDSYGLLMAD